MSKTKNKYIKVGTCKYNELCHAWSVAGDTEFGGTSCGRMSFNGVRMYSYNSLIAIKFPRLQLLVVDNYYLHYSNTTSHQIRALYDAFTHWDIVECDNVDTSIPTMLRKMKTYLLDFERNMQPFNKKGVPTTKCKREMYYKTYIGYNKLLEAGHYKDPMTPTQSVKVDTFAKLIKVYEQERLEIVIKQQKEREERERLEELQNRQTARLACEYLKEKFKENCFKTFRDCYTSIRDIIYNDPDYDVKFQNARKNGPVYVSLSEKCAACLEYLGYENSYTSEFGNNDITAGDVMYVETNGDLYTTRGVHITADQVPAIIMLLRRYLAQDNFESRKTLVINRHVGSFTIREVYEDHICVGCHTFANNYLRCFLKEYDMEKDNETR